MTAGSGSGELRRVALIALSAVVILALLAGMVGAMVVANTPTRETGRDLSGGGPGAAASPRGGTPGVSGAPGAAGTAPTGPGGGSVPTPPPVAPAANKCPTPGGSSATGVRVGLTRTAAQGSVISFGLPLPPGAVADPAALRVSAGGAPVGATVRTLLASYTPDGAPRGPRAVLIQVPTAVLAGDCAEVEVSWQGGGGAAPAGPAAQPFAATSVESPKTVTVATRSIVSQGGTAKLVETKREERTLYTGREPATMATFPAGYLGTTGILGKQADIGQLGPDLAGLQFLADQATPFMLSSSYLESYALNPASVIGPADTNEQAGINGYEGWLYDRCATYLVTAALTGDTRFLREGYRACSFYASKIELGGENRGFLTITPEPDDKFSHLRGLYAYYALTGDESALEAGKAVAELWLKDPFVLTPYRDGHLRGPDKLWTERQLGVGLEGLVYGHLLTGDTAYLRATQEVIATAHRHVTGDAAALAAINPDAPVFPPQNCFIHNAEQHSEGDLDQPWCSGWMPVLMVDALLAYQEQTNDPRVDEIFIRLTRFLRDTGSAYFKGDVLDDTFLNPSVAYNPNEDLEERRLLVPLYGSGRDGTGKRQNFGDYDDFQHCPDAMALTAVGLRALRRTGAFDQNPVGPFKSEGESFLALHQELAFCSSVMFAGQTRLRRDPAVIPADELANGLGNPAAYIEENEIGYSSRNTFPQRKVSWWFNVSLAQFGLLREAGVKVPEIRPGIIQPGTAPPRP